MRSNILIWTLLATCTFTLDANAQSVERGRPEQWNDLVFGGRFMDRFLPMPVQGRLTNETWGADNVKPRYIDNGLEDNEWSYWGGNAMLGDDGKYHLYVCRWREDSQRGHMEWGRSIVVHAVAEESTGPYKVKDTLGPGHNPELFQLKDGRYVVYVMRGYYIADRLDGPWESRKFEFDKRDRRIIEGLSNLTFSRREDGSFLMVCRGGGVWFSETGISPYNQVTDRRVYPPVEGRFEDPVVWRTNVQYHLIVNDWLGRIAYYLRSKDGINWKVEPGEAYLPGIAKYEDGTKVDWFKYERIKVLQDQYGRATQAHFAVIDVLKRSDKGSDSHSSKHICIPLTVGRLLTILDKKQITAETETIRVKIATEDGFDPHTDIDIDSLRFGASEEVNFGRGCKVVRTKRSGKDLIVTFEGSGNGITNKNFAAKLLGKTRRGKLLFGYARLPWLNYIEPALSARMPKFAQRNDGFDIFVEVQNFGQVASEPAPLKILNCTNNQDLEVATGQIPALKPFDKTTVELTCGGLFEVGTSYDLKVIIDPDGRNPAILHGRMTPKYVSLFDGKSFAGWEGDTAKTWRIEDGAITAGSLEEQAPRNEFLATTREYENFDLRLKFKITGNKRVNAGVQLRTKRIPSHHEVSGYQADIGPAVDGHLYDESRRRRMLATPDPAVLKKAQAEAGNDGWQTYRIRAEGSRIGLWLNGVQTVDYVEKDKSIPRTGIIALQIHGGMQAIIAYKDIEIEELTASPKRSRRN